MKLAVVALAVLAQVARAAPFEQVRLKPAETFVAKNADTALISRDGETTIVFDDQHVARLRGKDAPLVERKVLASRSAIAADGGSVLLRTYHDGTYAGLAVLRVPGGKPIYASDTAENAHYVDSKTIIFVSDGVPMSLDVASGKASVLGRRLPEFRCAHQEAAAPGGEKAEQLCKERRWGQVLGVDAKSRRWIVADLVAALGFADRIRLVDPKTGAATVIAEAKGGARLDPTVSPDATMICIQTWPRLADGSFRIGATACGPIGGPAVETAAGTVNFASAHTIAICDKTSTRFVDLATRKSTTIEDGNYYAVFLHPDGVHAFGRHSTAVFWLDLRAGTTSPIADTGQDAHTLAFDPADPRHVLVPRFVREHGSYDLYDLRW